MMMGCENKLSLVGPFIIYIIDMQRLTGLQKRAMQHFIHALVLISVIFGVMPQRVFNVLLSVLICD